MALASGPIYWEGYVPGFLNKNDEAKRIKTTTDAAAQCVQASQAVEIPGSDGVLAVRP